MMEIIKRQTLSGTRLDTQGERVPKKVLDSFCAQYAGKRMPLNQNHDLRMQSPGFVENICVVEDEKSPGDWSLVGDVHYDAESLEIALGGFSISYLEIVKRGIRQDLFQVYLPFPFYNDPDLIAQLFEDGLVSVGKWAKKHADPSTIALIGGALVFFITPVWDDIYKTKIAPRIYSFFRDKIGVLKAKNIGVNFVQYISYFDREIQVLFIPLREQAEACFTVDCTNQAMLAVHEYLNSRDITTPCITKLFLNFDASSGRYILYRVEHEDGSIIAPTSQFT
ncbi:MAG: hypothetical protein PHD65_03825 [Gallionella sp.]|nr:hypothetical protein [Gallionella sp.]